MQTPDIGKTVERFAEDGSGWHPDWVRMARVRRDNNPENDLLGVMVWGSDGARHRPGRDVWRERV